MSDNPAIKLSEATLQALSPEVRIPTYRRDELKQHTVHIGVGGFHRAHQALYLDDLLAVPGSERWGECGVGVLPADDRMRDALCGQDCLYTLVERSGDGQTARVIGSLVDSLHAPSERETVIERMAAPDTRIVSLTITEGGYFLDEGTGNFLADHPAIQYDVQHPEAPATSLGLIAAALDRRRQRGLPAFTVMSCDNLQGNGDITRRVLLGFTGLGNPALQQWIAENVAFPNSMVDRITPVTTAADRAFVAEHFKVQDAWPVVAEPFRQWVIEDHFCNGRPAWETVGAQMIQDVAPYEIMKMRLLNGSHLAMAYLGALAGFIYVHEILADPLFRSFIAAFMEEVTPVVPFIPGTSVTEYKQTLMERFSNPTINDQVTRICSEGSAKHPKWLLPSIVDLNRKGGRTKLLSLVVAAWIFYLGHGRNERGEPLEILDARAGELTKLAASADLSPVPVLQVRTIFGEQLPANAAFVKAVEKAMRSLAAEGTRSTIQAWMRD
ncbi:mannitol dehydrogenase family protein [Terriglobus sp.]|uniref:mannitol dehydrogenase family protein n=1 Tax=Terriglobus sp. TaxID=1889013 RepID=UPI003B00310A